MDRIPKKQLNKANTASHCDTYSAKIKEGDLLLMFSDGLSDNLHEWELLNIVDRLGLLNCTPPASIAKDLALAAQERSMDREAIVPFTETAKRYGRECHGGKEDDITVAAAWVVADQSGLAGNVYRLAGS